MVLCPDEFRGGVFALVPACATPDAYKWSARDTFDKEVFSALVDRLIEDGMEKLWGRKWKADTIIRKIQKTSETASS